MAYQSSYESSHPYARDSFGRRQPDYGMPVPAAVSRGVHYATLAAAVLFAIWSGVTTIYLLFGDDVLRRISVAQSETARAQEAQIAALTTEIERLRSTKFVDQETVERQLGELANIRRMVEARQRALGSLAQSVTGDPSITGSIRAAPAPDPLPSAEEAPKPRPLSDTLLVDPPLNRSTATQSRFQVAHALPGNGIEPAKRKEISTAARALSGFSARQAQTLNTIELDLDERAARVKKAFAELGIRPPTKPVRSQLAGIGGPFVPYQAVPEDAFMRQVFRVRLAMAEHERLAKNLDGLPVTMPVFGPAEITSGFGPRLDPFNKRLAIHAGVDLRGDVGDPVRAAAAGTVVVAVRHRAYGLMVEIDHGNGLSTRYAHLSAIRVNEGTVVPAGALVGKIGSTGRSTAPHLHFEVRQNGEAIDPRRYLRAARTLAGHP